MHDVPAVLTSWNSFYVVAGSGAAALIGLMFIVITLVRESETGTTREGISTFSTPTVVHLCFALFVSLLMLVPVDAVRGVAVVAALAGIAGAAYTVRIALRAARITVYRPDLEDWICYTALPLLAYISLAAGAPALWMGAPAALYVPAGTVVALIFVSIHNAWDVVTYVTIPVGTPPDAHAEPSPPST